MICQFAQGVVCELGHARGGVAVRRGRGDRGQVALCVVGVGGDVAQRFAKAIVGAGGRYSRAGIELL